MTRETLEKIKQEKIELDEKIKKLSNFVFKNENLYLSLSDANFYLLRDQYNIMKEYSKILQYRIELNENNIEDEK